MVNEMAAVLPAGSTTVRMCLPGGWESLFRLINKKEIRLQVSDKYLRPTAVFPRKLPGIFHKKNKKETFDMNPES